ncbi:unnamed protein product [Rotaria magnacalcarata]|nr:unnamed protein product [Rotaria magnacalcarata]
MRSSGGGGGGYQYPQGTTIQRVPFDSNRTAQNNNTNSQSYFVERHSTNRLPYNESKTITIQHTTQSRRVNPALTINPNQQPRSQSANYGKPKYTYKRDMRSEIDDSPIIDPSAFRYLNLNERKAKTTATSGNDFESGIDTRSIINLDAVTQLERRRQQLLEKNNRLRGDDGPKEGIDDRSIIDSNAFRYIEAKTSKSQKQGQGFDGGIDDRPIVNPDAFKYIDARRQGKPVKQSNEPSIDTRPIVNPDAFKYIEKRDVPLKRSTDGGIDSEPIVNPAAFRYLEKQGPPPRRDVQSGVDTTSIVDPDAFQYIERRRPVRSAPAESSIDYSPIVSPDAFKWIEQKHTTRRRINNEPEIDERSYVNPQAFRYIDRNLTKRNDIPKSEIDSRSLILDRNPNAFVHLERKYNNNRRNEIESGIDQRSYVDPDAFRYIEGQRKNARNKIKYSPLDPTIDTRSYVDTESFRHLENKKNTKNSHHYDRDIIDERPFIPPIAFRHLEFSEDQYNYPYDISYALYGQTDV